MNIESTPATGGATLYAQARSMKEEGASLEAAIDHLVGAGMDPNRARDLAWSVYGSPNRGVATEAVKVVGRGSASLARSVLAGLGVAIICAMIWGGLVAVTGFYIGYAAWGLGAAVGFGVYAGTPEEHRGHAHLPLIASACAIFGIIIGQYFCLVFYVAHNTSAGVSALQLLSYNGVTLFFNNIGKLFDPIGLIFMVLAVISAYKIAAQDQ